MASGNEKAPPAGQDQALPDKEQLEKSVAAARKVVEAQKTAESLKERAKKAVDPKERIRLLQDAYNKEVEAHGHSKYAKRLQSGAWQGAAAGGGIGGGVAMGLGGLVGTLVTGVAGIPVVLLGGLIGAGVGGIRGPFINFGDGKGQKPMTEEEIHAQAVKEAETLDQAVEKGANTVPQPPQLEGTVDDQISSGDKPSPDESAVDSVALHNSTPTQAPKRAPRKLEMRSGNEIKAPPERKKPRKLEVRSSSERKENV